MLPPFLLIHGAWHGKWCWELLQQALADRGARSLAIDLPGHGDKRRNAWRVGWSDYVACVLEAAAGMDQRPILVGHSMGGGVITSATDRAPELFAGLIYLAAFVPNDGDSIMALASRGATPSGLKVRPWRCDSVFSTEDAQRHFFHDCGEGGRWAAKVQPQPMRPVFTRLHLRFARRSRLIPRLYRGAGGPSNPRRLTTRDGKTCWYRGASRNKHRPLAFFGPAIPARKSTSRDC